MATESTEPNPSSFFPLHPTFSEEGGKHNFPSGGPRFLWVPWLIWGGAEGQRCPFNHLPQKFPEEPFFLPCRNIENPECQKRRVLGVSNAHGRHGTSRRQLNDGIEGIDPAQGNNL